MMIRSMILDSPAQYLQRSGVWTRDANMFGRRAFLRHIYGGLSLAAVRAIAPSSGNLMPEKQPLVWDVHFHLTDVPGETPEDRMKEIVKYLGLTEGLGSPAANAGDSHQSLCQCGFAIADGFNRQL